MCDLTGSPLLTSMGRGGGGGRARSGGEELPGQPPQAVDQSPGREEQESASFSSGLSGRSELKFCAFRST